MTASPPKVNGHARPPALQVLGDWQPVATEPEPAEEQRNPEPEPANPEPTAADVEVARARAWAEAEERRVAAEAAKEERRIKAEAEAEAIRAKAEEDARKARLANDRAERKAAEEQAASAARIAEHQRRRDDADRARERAAREDAEQQKTETDKAAVVAKSSKRWRRVALGFYALCAAVALPVQMAAFWDPNAKYLLVAPIFIEVIALVALVGAAAAVTDGRPQWHYRLVAWAGALTAATINAVHGLGAFDAATAFGTALASVAGPGMWDLHEHGRIRKRDGAPTRGERKAAEKEAKRIAAEKAAEEKRRAAEKKAAEEAAAEAAEMLAGARAEEFPEVWDEAEKIAAAVGEVTVTEKVWARAYRNIQGCEPGESIESITARSKAEKRVQSALTGTPVNTLSKTTNAQRAWQMPPSTPGRVYTPPTRAGRRTRGDTPRYVGAARKQAAITAKNATKSTRPNAN
ncbi:hypothetical protein TPA0906_66430 [Streptomyces olivaceus]|uniref:hypothetical protein n=1 Tax=Streptomyces olivaceus TaxID=47716 RepID=UPI0022EF038B|nr:hypothetical protein [Streptomyces olivaceus]GHJ04778.1 hypothetical protein TPA0906_66430 [Streptomyces olivaceus]